MFRVATAALSVSNPLELAAVSVRALRAANYSNNTRRWSSVPNKKRDMERVASNLTVIHRRLKAETCGAVAMTDIFAGNLEELLPRYDEIGSAGESAGEVTTPA